MNNQIQWDEAEVQKARELALERAKAEALKANDRLLISFTSAVKPCLVYKDTTPTYDMMMRLERYTPFVWTIEAYGIANPEEAKN